MSWEIGPEHMLFSLALEFITMFCLLVAVARMMEKDLGLSVFLGSFVKDSIRFSQEFERKMGVPEMPL